MRKAKANIVNTTEKMLVINAKGEREYVNKDAYKKEQKAKKTKKEVK